MNLKKTVRSGISLAIALTLIVTAGVLKQEKAGYRAGRGDGVNEKVVRLEELSSLLSDCFSVGAGREVNLAAVSENQYSSVTMSEVSSVSMLYEMHQNGTQARNENIALDMQREMTAYLTQNEVLYDSQVTVSSAESQGEPMDYVFHIIIYMGPDTAMIRFDELIVAQEKVIASPIEKVRGKWIGGSSADSNNIFDAMTSINQTNFQILNLIGDFLRTNDSSAFIQNGNSYTMTDEAYKEFVNGMIAMLGVGTSEILQKTEGTFEANFSDAETPRVSITIGNNAEESSQYGRYAVNLSETEEFIFSNINNTVIELPQEIDVISFDELADFMEA